MEIVVFYTGFGSHEEAAKVSDTLVQEQLAACSAILPGKSSFFWEDVFHSAKDEVLVLLKTHPKREEELRKRLQELHPYELPLILSWQGTVNDEYGKWVAERVAITE